jgi:REP element-mobilizing transposase RayT
MARVARYVAPGVAHDIAQRGTARQIVFRTRADRRVHLGLLREQASFLGLSILAYCLMSNHIHLIAVPPEEDSLAILLRRVHGRFAQYFNARQSRSGLLWQKRFYSCPLGPGHLWTAIRYAELNPVRAGLAVEPAAYEWPSASVHFAGLDTRRLLDAHFFEEAGGGAGGTGSAANPTASSPTAPCASRHFPANPLEIKYFWMRFRRGGENVRRTRTLPLSRGPRRECWQRRSEPRRRPPEGRTQNAP